ncbi:MAG: hypothetical protein R6U26_03510 [Candidatus Undinarchaeales archaeon]
MSKKDRIVEGSIEIETEIGKLKKAVELLKKINKTDDDVNIIILKHEDGRIELHMPPLPKVKNIEELMWDFKERRQYLQSLSTCAVEAWLIAKNVEALDKVIEILKENGFEKGIFMESVGESKKGNYKRYVYT